MQANNQQGNEQQNPYIFGDADADRYRLESQATIFSDYIRANATRVVGSNIHRILDLGGGEGQLSVVLREIYPDAHIVCIDRDPEAIAAARQQTQPAGGGKIEYLVGDVEQGLPDGPFDLVYASMLMQHIIQHDALIAAVYQQLAAGGYFWLKDPDNRVMTAFDNPDYRELMRLLYQTSEAIGANPYISDYLADKLRAAGFNDVRSEEEQYELGGESKAGRTMMGITLGVFHGTMPYMSRVSGVSNAELQAMYVRTVNAAMETKAASVQIFRNTIGRKPALGQRRDER